MDSAEVVSSTANTAFAVDSSGAIVAWNGEAERLFGYPASQMLGHLCGEILSGRDVYGNAYCGARCPLLEMTRSREPISRFNLLYREPADNEIRCSVVFSGS